MSKEQRTTSNELLLTKSRTTQESKQIMIVMNYNQLNKTTKRVHSEINILQNIFKSISQ